MNSPTTFMRYEIKYLLSACQQEALFQVMEDRMQPDRFGNSTICNLYLDTPSHLLIRRSLERPVYKEKLRIRSYGRAQAQSDVYVELKKKYKGVVYKRREGMHWEQAREWMLTGGSAPGDSQITREIDYFCSLYSGLTPAVYLSYERQAFFGVEDSSLRMTFDQNIFWRENELLLTAGVGGAPLLSQGERLLEVKCAYGLPFWLIEFFKDTGVYKTSFSKYGNAYRAIQARRQEGGSKSA